MSKNFFSAVAGCVAKGGMSEAYILIGEDAMTSLGDAHLSALLDNFDDGNLRVKDRIARDYNMLPEGREVIFTDKAQGFICVDGVVVSFSVAPLSDEHLRAHFVRVDAAALYSSTQERLSNLEKDVSAILKRGAQLN